MRASLTDNNAVRFGFGQAEFGSYLCTVPKRQLSSAAKNLSLMTGKTYRFAAVRFPGGQKIYHYRCDADLKIGDQAVVMTGQGEKRVTVTDIFEMSESEMKFPLEQYKVIKQKV